jgi:hypothetical protein
VYGDVPPLIATPVTEPVGSPQLAAVTTAVAVSGTGSGFRIIFTCVAALVQLPTVSVAQYETLPVGTGGVNGLLVLATVVRPASEYHVMVPPLPVALSGDGVLPEHKLTVPEVTAGAAGVGLIVRIMLSVTVPQMPAGSSLLIYSTTLPAVMSAAEGVYTAVSVVAPAKVPVPELVHNNAAALPPIESPVIV